MVRTHWYDVQPLHQFAKPAPDTVALGSGTVFLGDGETDPDRAVIVVTHDSRVFKYGDRIVRLNDGRIESVMTQAGESGE